MAHDGEAAGGVQRLTVKQAAERIGRRPRTVNDLIHKGRLTGFKHEGRLYTTDLACEEFLSWYPPEGRGGVVAAPEDSALSTGMPAASREAEEVQATLRELEARVGAMPPSAALLVLQQCLRHVGKAAALLATLAAGFLWTQQVADSAVGLGRGLLA